jgi:nucleolar pre-ribosomal-associated protein 1
MVAEAWCVTLRDRVLQLTSLDSLHLSPFSTLLMIVSSGTGGIESLRKIKGLLSSIVVDHGILQTSTEITALDALINSLAEASQTNEILNYLDNCIGRFVQKPIKYMDDYDMMNVRLQKPTQDQTSAKPLSMALMAIVEQWPFLVKASGSTSHFKIVAEWLARLLAIFKHIGEDDAVVNHVFAEIHANSTKEIQRILSKRFNSLDEQSLKHLKNCTRKEEDSTDVVSTEEQLLLEHSTLAINLDAPPVEDEDHRGLYKWAQKDPDEAIEEGAAGELLQCLCSVHVGIRREALTNLQKLAIKLKVPLQKMLRRRF